MCVYMGGITTYYSYRATVHTNIHVVKSHTPNDPLVVAPPHIPYMSLSLVSRAYVIITTS